jgi:hypothetical protein
MRQRTPKTILFIQSLFVIFLVSCTPTVSPPVRASWSEQYTAAQRAVKDLGSEFVLAQASALPARLEPGAPDEPIELVVILVFESLKSTGVITENVPGYAMQIVEYNDHRLVTTLSAEAVLLGSYAPSSASLTRATMLQMGPQDVLQMTLREGETYMGKPVDRGNINIHLVWDISENHPELKDALAPVWHITYYRENIQLHILIDAQTGAILKRYEGLY